MSRRFIIHAGLVISRTDGDKHYIGVGRVMELYQLTPEEKQRAVFADVKWRIEPRPDDVHLRPRFDGDYSRFWDKPED